MSISMTPRVPAAARVTPPQVGNVFRHDQTASSIAKTPFWSEREIIMLSPNAPLQTKPYLHRVISQRRLASFEKVRL